MTASLADFCFFLMGLVTPNLRNAALCLRYDSFHTYIGNYIVHPVALAFSTSAVGWDIKPPSQELQNTNGVSLR